MFILEAPALKRSRKRVGIGVTFGVDVQNADRSVMVAGSWRDFAIVVV